MKINKLIIVLAILFLLISLKVKIIGQDTVTVSSYYLTKFPKKEVLFIEFNKARKEKGLTYIHTSLHTFNSYTFIDKSFWGLSGDTVHTKDGIYKLFQAMPFYVCTDAISLSIPYYYKDVFKQNGLTYKHSDYPITDKYFELECDSSSYYTLHYVKGKALRIIKMPDKDKYEFIGQQVDYSRPFYHYLMYDYSITTIDSLPGFKFVNMHKSLESYKLPLEQQQKLDGTYVEKLDDNEEEDE